MRILDAWLVKPEKYSTVKSISISLDKVINDKTVQIKFSEMVRLMQTEMMFNGNQTSLIKGELICLLREIPFRMRNRMVSRNRVFNHSEGLARGVRAKTRKKMMIRMMMLV